MKLLFTASEAVPFVKTGGLADVVGALAPVLAEEGNDVRVVIPLFSAIPQEYTQQMTHVCDFEVQLGWRRQYCGVEMLRQNGVIWYFIDNKYYFGRAYLYGMGGDEYERFGFFCRAVLNMLPLIDFQPEVIHAHDWQSGMIPALLKIQYAHLPFYQGIKTIFTIHNLQYQGIFGVEDVKDVLNLDDEYFTDDKLECYGCANYMKAGLVYADEITTVSPSYAEEICTYVYGEGLDPVLANRRDRLQGILNGIDNKKYDPETDPDLYYSFNQDNLREKRKNKLAFQREFGLEEDEKVPMFGLISRSICCSVIFRKSYPDGIGMGGKEIGRASCRERV